MVVSGVAGWFAGSIGRLVLAALPRGTVVARGWCEWSTAVLWAVVGARAGLGELPGWWVPVPLALTWFGVLLTATDLRHRRLPDALTLSAYPVFGAALAVAAATGGGWALGARAVLGALVFCGLHALVRTWRPGSLGAGDVKLAGSVGAVLGAVGWPALVLAALLAAVVTLGLGLAARGEVASRWRSGIPHGPGLLAAAWLVAAFPGTGL